MGSKVLRRVQLGQESTPGTVVAATTIWGGPADSIEDTRVITIVPQDIGRLSGGLRSYTAKVEAQYDMPASAVSYQQLPHVMQATFGSVAAVNDGSGRVRAYAMPTSTVISPKTYTVETGDEAQAYHMAYAFVSKFKMTGKLQEALDIQPTWTGRQMIQSAFTSSLSVPTNMREAMFGSGKLYLDSSSIGSTQITGTFMGFELDVEPGTMAYYTADGNLFFTSIRQGAPKITLNLTFEHNSSAVSEETHFANEDVRLIRMDFPGPALGTPGVSWTTQMIRVDMAGKWTKFAKMTDEKGIDTITGTLEIGDDLAGHFLAMTVVNEDSVIP